MTTFAELLEYNNVFAIGDMLRINCDPLLNWYGCYSGLNCPFCNNTIKWEWDEEQIPSITTRESTSHLKPAVTGATLLNHGHRYIQVKCNSCENEMQVDNFD